MEQIKKIRVAMICCFSNKCVRDNLPLLDGRLFAFTHRLFDRSSVRRIYGDIAPWNTATIDFFKSREDVELHVIGEHAGLKRRVVSYCKDGVHYNFVNGDLTGLLRRFVKNDDLWRKLSPLTRDVHRLLRRINPDIVLLMGLENAGYSSSVLGIKDYPVYGLCQTIYNNPERATFGAVDSKNASTELKILKEHHYFGAYCKKHYKLLRDLAPNAIIFKFGFPSKGELLQITSSEKVYDFVNFAKSMSAAKGFTDAIKALALVKKKYPKVSLNLVGGYNDSQKNVLVELANSLGVGENVVFTPFFEKQSDLFLHIQKSHFAVLPCKLDNISGTMIQAMQLSLPMVVYKTTGAPALNREKQCALIAEKENVEELAQHMLSLMENPELVESLKKNARDYQEKKVEATSHNGERLIENFKAIIANYHKGTPIPQDLLFNPDKDD